MATPERKPIFEVPANHWRKLEPEMQVGRDAVWLLAGPTGDLVAVDEAQLNELRENGQVVEA
jgi:hypothetical protein